MIKSCKTIQEKIKINFLYLILGFVILNFTNCAKDTVTVVKDSVTVVKDSVTDYRDQYLGIWTATNSADFTGTGVLSYDSFKSDILKYVGTDNFLGTFPYNNVKNIPIPLNYTATKIENDTKGLVFTSTYSKDTLYVNTDGTVDLTNAAKRKLVNYTSEYDSFVNQFTTKNYDLVLEEKSINYSIKFNSNLNLVITLNVTLRLKSTIKNFNKTFPFTTVYNYTKK